MYGFKTRLDGSFDEAVTRVREALAAEGFGVLSDIDVQVTLKNKLGIERRPYRILGACNPTMAHEALKLETHVGAMLPCNVVIQQAEDGVEVFAIDPAASMQAIDNPALLAHAGKVGEHLRAAVDEI